MNDSTVKNLPRITSADANDLLHIVSNPDLATPVDSGIEVSNVIVSFERTAAEIAAAVVPSDLRYDEGDIRRYGAVGDGVANDTQPILDAIVVAKQDVGVQIVIPQGTFFTNNTLVFDVSDDTTIIWYGVVTTDVSAKTAVQLGDTASQTLRLTVIGGIRLDRTTDDIGGTSVGVEIVRCQFWTVRIDRSTGFGDGVLVSGVGGGNTHGHLYLEHIHDNTKNLRFTADASGFCNEHQIYGGSFSYSAAYADFTNTVNLTVDHNATSNLNNIVFLKPALEAIDVLTKAATINGTNITIFHPRMERIASQSTYEIEFTANAVECAIVAKGFTLLRTNITDNGANTTFVTREGSFESHQVIAQVGNTPLATDPSCHRVQSTSSGAALGYSTLDTAGVLKYSVGVDGKIYSASQAFFNTGIRWQTGDGTNNDRGLFRGSGSPEGVTSASPGSVYSNASGGPGSVFYEKGSGTGNTGWVALGQPVKSTANLEDITNAINTSADKIEGQQVFNSVTNKPVWAAGNADGDVWVDATGATAHTPV